MTDQDKPDLPALIDMFDIPGRGLPTPQLPLLKIKASKWMLGDTPIDSETINMVLFSRMEYRMLYGYDYNTGNRIGGGKETPIVCRSWNGIEARGIARRIDHNSPADQIQWVEEIDDRYCWETGSGEPTCPMAQWVETHEDGFKRNVCACPPRLNFLVMVNFGDAEVWQACRFDVSGKSVKALNTAFRNVTDASARTIGSKSEVPCWGFKFSVGIHNSYGNSWEPQFGHPKVLDNKQAMQVYSWAKEEGAATWSKMKEMAQRSMGWVGKPKEETNGDEHHAQPSSRMPDIDQVPF